MVLSVRLFWYVFVLHERVQALRVLFMARRVVFLRQLLRPQRRRGTVCGGGVSRTMVDRGLGMERFDLPSAFLPRCVLLVARSWLLYTLASGRASLPPRERLRRKKLCLCTVCRQGEEKVLPSTSAISTLKLDNTLGSDMRKNVFFFTI